MHSITLFGFDKEKVRVHYNADFSGDAHVVLGYETDATNEVRFPAWLIKPAIDAQLEQDARRKEAELKDLLKLCRLNIQQGLKHANPIRRERLLKCRTSCNEAGRLIRSKRFYEADAILKEVYSHL